MKWAKTSPDDWFAARLVRCWKGGRAVATVARKRRAAPTKDKDGSLFIASFPIESRKKSQRKAPRDRDSRARRRPVYVSAAPFYGGCRHGHARGLFGPSPSHLHILTPAHTCSTSICRFADLQTARKVREAASCKARSDSRGAAASQMTASAPPRANGAPCERVAARR